MGKVLNDTIAPGVLWTWPFIEDVDQFQNNTIILETTAGTGRNTKDQNMLSAENRFHYTIDPTQGSIALHLSTMSDDNGKTLLEGLMDQSFDAVVGARPASNHMADPEALLSGFADNLEWRLKQNNVPISIDAIELLTLTVGDGTTPYRMPVQLRIRRTKKDGKAGWAIEDMAGPAAIPIESAGHIIKPNTKQPIQDTADAKKDTLVLKLQ